MRTEIQFSSEEIREAIRSLSAIESRLLDYYEEWTSICQNDLILLPEKEQEKIKILGRKYDDIRQMVSEKIDMLKRVCEVYENCEKENMRVVEQLPVKVTASDERKSDGESLLDSWNGIILPQITFGRGLLYDEWLRDWLRVFDFGEINEIFGHSS